MSLRWLGWDGGAPQKDGSRRDSAATDVSGKYKDWGKSWPEQKKRSENSELRVHCIGWRSNTMSGQSSGSGNSTRMNEDREIHRMSLDSLGGRALEARAAERHAEELCG
jgi:hypothetical protein